MLQLADAGGMFASNGSFDLAGSFCVCDEIIDESPTFTCSDVETAINECG